MTEREIVRLITKWYKTFNKDDYAVDDQPVGWLSPKGNFALCSLAPYSSHSDFMYHVLNSFDHDKFRELFHLVTTSRPYAPMYELGWVRVDTNCYRADTPNVPIRGNFMGNKQQLTPKQKRWLAFKCPTFLARLNKEGV